MSEPHVTLDPNQLAPSAQKLRGPLEDQLSSALQLATEKVFGGQVVDPARVGLVMRGGGAGTAFGEVTSLRAPADKADAFEKALKELIDPATLGVEMAETDNQGDAESWLGENWRDLLDKGVATVTLFDGDDEVYGPMGLAAP